MDLAIPTLLLLPQSAFGIPVSATDGDKPGPSHHNETQPQSGWVKEPDNSEQTDCDECEDMDTTETKTSPTTHPPEPAVRAPRSKSWPRMNTSHEISSIHREVDHSAWSWSPNLSLFTVAGGFCVDSSSFFPKERLYFTPAGIIELARLGLLPHIDEEAIQDRSKADVFAKSIVIIQVTWFLLQTLARLIQKLPVSLLELHTLTQVGCTFFMYALWMKKPYDIGSPVTLDDPRVVEMAALFALSVSNRAQRMTEEEPIYGCLQHHFPVLEHVKVTHVQNMKKHTPLRHVQLMLFPNSYIPHLFNDALTDDKKAKQQLLLACRAVDRIKSEGLHFKWHEYVPNEEEIAHEYFSKAFVFPGAQYVTDKISQTVAEDSTRGTTNDFQRSYESKNNVLVIKLKKLLTFTALSAAYGGAHLAAWNYDFPSVLEKWMWRASGLAFAGVPFVYTANDFLRIYNGVATMFGSQVHADEADER
ncbi:MAG: hypothetical protein M1831_004339 [Alyxoria varia]|nr:MAG: hypothetical protein M1831_004339 [Alyxoria varia]